MGARTSRLGVSRESLCRIRRAAGAASSVPASEAASAAASACTSSLACASIRRSCREERWADGRAHEQERLGGWDTQKTCAHVRVRAVMA